MLVSCVVLSNSLKSHKEKFESKTEKEKRISATYLILSIILFIIELMLFILALFIALKCQKQGIDKALHIMVAILFPLPYLLLMLVFSKCAQNIVEGEDINFESPKYSPSLN